MLETSNGYIVEGETIVFQRELNKLDLFLKKFLDVLKKHSDYLVVSGFVSICSGRTRATEDIDILVPVMEKERFIEFFSNMKENSFWCYQGDDVNEIYSYVEEMNNIRFAEKNTMYPNIEFIPINEIKKTKWFEFTHPQKVRIKALEFNIPPIEFEILYKEIILRGDKDIADAKHLRTFFSDILDENKFQEYGPIVREELK